MYCRHCGKEIRDNASFCPSCGRPVGQEHKPYNQNDKRKKKKWFWIFPLLMLIILVLLAGGKVIYSLYNGAGDQNQDQGKSDDGNTDKISGIEDIVTYTEKIGEPCGYKNALSNLTEKVTTTIDGDTYYRMQQNYKGIPVYGRTAVCVTDENEKVVSVNGNMLDVDENIDVTPTITGNQAVGFIEDYMNNEIDSDDAKNIEIPQPDDSDLCIYTYSEDGKAHLAYHVCFGYFEVVVDAQNGEILSFHENMKMDTGYAASDVEQKNGFYIEKNENDLYQLKNSALRFSVLNLNGKTHAKTKNMENSTSIESLDSIFGNDANEEGYEEAVRYYQNVSIITERLAAVCGFENAWLLAFYNDGYASGKNAYGGTWGEIDGKPVGVISMGSVTGVDDIDVIGHEYGHAISYVTVAWQGDNMETGAINEGISDIFGEIAEAWYTKSDSVDWIHTNKNVNVKRNIKNPNDAGYASTVNDSSLWNEFWTGEEYYYSTVISRVGYLMWNGIDGNKNKKIPIDNLAKLWYRAMLMMPSDCDFSTCRQLVEWSALSIDGMTKDQRQCISEAFDMVGIQDVELPPKLFVDCDRNVRRDSVLNVYDADKNLYSNYVINISGTIAEHELAYSSDILLDLGHRYEHTEEVNQDGSYHIDLPDGYYTFTISDNNNPVYTYSFTVSVSEQGTEDVIDLYTDFQNRLLVVIDEEEEKKTTEEKSNEPTDNETNNTTPDSGDLLMQFIRNGEYMQYIQEWELAAKAYCILDINKDGIDELILSSEDEGGGFAEYQVYALQDSRIVMVKDFYACYGFSYSEAYHSIVYTETRPSADYRYAMFCSFDGTQMVDIFHIIEELDIDTFEQKYAKVAGDVETALTEDEYMQYMNETVSVTEWIEI